MVLLFGYLVAEMTTSLFLQNGYSLLHSAAMGGSIELVDWLVSKHGLDVNEWTEVCVCACVCACMFASFGVTPLIPLICIILSIFA